MEKAYKVRAIRCSHKASQEEIYERLKTITDPLTPVARTWGYAYDGAGDLVSHTDPEGGVTQYVYDAEHQITEILDPLGNSRASMVYDAFSRVVESQQDALGNTTSFSCFPSAEFGPNRGLK